MQRIASYLLALGLLASPASSHDMWIVPPESPAGAGDLVKVELRVGHAGEEHPVRRNSGRVVRFDAVGPAGELPVPGLDGADPAGYFRPREPGTWAIAYESTSAFSELPGARFNGYLREEGLDAVLQRRHAQGRQDSPGRELYSRSLKSLVAVGPGVTPVDRRIGLPLELVAESGLRGEKPLVLRLFLRGEPLAGARVDVRRLDREPSTDTPMSSAIGARTGADGRVRFELGPGTWLAATVSMEEADSDRADWRSIFATLSLRIPAAGLAPHTEGGD